MFIIVHNLVNDRLGWTHVLKERIGSQIISSIYFRHTEMIHCLEDVLLLAQVKDLEGLLGSLETAESHGTKSRACTC